MKQISTIERSAGVLMHITSLPSSHGIGDLGEEAYSFVDWLASAGQTLWQVLPLGPTGYGNSPYSSYSAFAGNPLLISLDSFVKAGYLSAADCIPATKFSTKKVEFDKVIAFKMPRFRAAYKHFREKASFHETLTFREFIRKNAYWLENYALFMALKSQNGMSAWNTWDTDAKMATPNFMEAAKRELADEIGFHQFLQYQFAVQWQKLRGYANEVGIKMISDIPIFVAGDSADVWGNKEYFQLNDEGSPIAVAGVPPDYFSETGQLWGNPHYDWERMKSDGFLWWKRRFAKQFELCDIVRIDHFRGFEAYWEIPGGEKTAINGKWVKAPGDALFSALQAEFGNIPMIAEDLGVITDEVTALRKKFGFPGMKIFQFGLESADPTDAFLPHNFERDCIVYTGTHDNDTTLGWLHSAKPEALEFTNAYVGSNSKSSAIADMIRMIYSSVALSAIVPIQDLLLLDTSARMNFPGKSEGNWEFRMSAGALTKETAGFLRLISHAYRRNGR